MTELTVLTPPEGPAVSLDEVKAYLRIGHDGEDSFLEQLIERATDRLEQASGLALMSQTLRVCWQAWPEGIEGRGAYLPVGPVRQLDSVLVCQPEQDPVDVTANFWLNCGRLSLRAWSQKPPLSPNQTVSITFMAGYAGACTQGAQCEVPADLIQALLTLCGAHYQTRGQAGSEQQELPAAVVSILKARRGMRL